MRRTVFGFYFVVNQQLWTPFVRTSDLSQWDCIEFIALRQLTGKLALKLSRRRLWRDQPNRVAFCFAGRPPGPEMEYCTDRESYSLAAGLALGMVCLGVSRVPAFRCCSDSICLSRQRPWLIALNAALPYCALADPDSVLFSSFGIFFKVSDLGMERNCSEE